ncbi:MAG: hypothetical protein RIA64_11015 [Rhodospirillales bacterium]
MTSNQVTSISPMNRSRVSNGTDILAGIDGRSAVARRYRDIIQEISTDLGGELTETQLQIARRAASLAIWCESQESMMANGGELNISEFTTATNALRRLLADLGYAKVPRDVTPSLAEILG